MLLRGFMTGPGQKLKLASAQLEKLRGAFAGVGLFSGCISILMLTGSIYMMQVYDRVLSSRSIPTLIGISLIVLLVFVIQGVLDAVRSRMLARIGAEFDHGLSPTVFDMMRLLPLRGARSDQAMQGVRDLDTVRGFLTSAGPTAFFDMPFMPIFFIGCFILHPAVGLLALVGGVIIVGLTLWTERRTKQSSQVLTTISSERLSLAEASRRNAEALQAMGMGPVFKERWRDVNQRYVATNLGVSDSVNSIGAAAKVFRMAFQSAVLGLGAYLVIIQQMSPGAMIAASILTSRALAPIETAVAHWRGFVASRQSFHRLNELLDVDAHEKSKTQLPAPYLNFVAEDLAVGIPGRQTPMVVGANINLKAGQGLLVIGPSGSGKSTLVRALAGVWPAMRGSARLDGAALDQWDPAQLGRHVGYMPQDVELFEGTVAQNIARFNPGATDQDIVDAAKAAGAHDMIVKFSQGYGTRIGEAGLTLSGGQRQRVGLARALFQSPFLMILDEPNSNLDTDGGAALVASVANARERGAVVIIVSHKMALLDAVDFVGRVQNGRLHVISRQDYIERMNKASKVAQPIPTPTAAQSNIGENTVGEQVAMLRAAATSMSDPVSAMTESRIPAQFKIQKDGSK